MEQQTIQPRQVAYIVRIKDILTGKFVKESGWNPNYVLVGDMHVSRVNIIGAVIDVQGEAMQTITIDDGTGKIAMRDFEQRADVAIGDVVLIVGRIRQFNNETYIAPEIVKKDLDMKWSLIWKKLALKHDEQTIQPIETIKVVETEDDEQPHYRQKILETIKDLDTGDGADHEEVMKIIRDEKMLHNLLLQVEIFEVRPGKLKVLD